MLGLGLGVVLGLGALLGLGLKAVFCLGFMAFRVRGLGILLGSG